MQWEWDWDAYKRKPLKELIFELYDFVMERARDTQLNQVASSLTLTTVLSLVPLLAVILVMFAVFPEFAQRRAELESLVFSHFLPEAYGQIILKYVRDFTGHAQGLTIFGLAGLGATALLLINTIDTTLNRIFHVRQMRHIMQRVLLYWALLTVGPAVILVSLSITNFLSQLNIGMQGSIPGWIAVAIQLLIQTFFYAAIYVYVPNCKVKWSHAFIGAGIVTVLAIGVKWGFSIYLSSGPLTTIYGTFAVIPVVLLWIYLSWLFVLAGAAIAATIPMLTSGRFADHHKTGNDFITGIALLQALMIAQEQGENAVSIHRLCQAVDSYPEAAGSVLERLAEVGYVGKLEADRKNDERWSLIVPPHTTSLSAAFDALLVDQSISLIARENSPMYDWYCLISQAEWKHRPMFESLRLIHPIN